jgi:hypothetical protein
MKLKCLSAVGPFGSSAYHQGTLGSPSPYTLTRRLDAPFVGRNKKVRHAVFRHAYARAVVADGNKVGLGRNGRRSRG